MTQKEAVYEALNELGGRSANKMIYKHALPKADFSNAKTPKNTIRAILQRHPLIQEAVGKPAGWWELCSYNEEREQLKAEIDAKVLPFACLMMVSLGNRGPMFPFMRKSVEDTLLC